MKRIMILGAGVYQVPLIKRARDEGYYTIVVSIPGNYPGFKIANEVAYIDTTDYCSVYKLAKEKKIDAIVTTGTDVALVSIGYVCDKLNLNGISYDAAQLSTDKARMKAAFVAGNVRTAKYFVVHNLAEAEKAAQKIGYPVMIKIVDKSGSRGISKVEKESEIEEAFKYALNATNKDYLIVEKFINAHEIGIDAFIQNDEIKIFLPHDKFVLHNCHADIPKGHMIPLKINQTLYEELYKQTQLAVKALHLNNCAVNIDAFIDQDDNAYIIEATGRCGATGIPEIISKYLHVDYYKVMLENALDYSVDFNLETVSSANQCYVGSSLIFSSRTGRLKKIAVSSQSLTEEDNIEVDYEIGDMVRKAENGTDRLGMAIFKAKSYEELLKEMKYFEQNLEIEVE